MVIRRFNFIKLFIALFFVGASLTIGISGFMLIERYTLTEAIYMTMITISTVGYQEVQPLSAEGRLFTAVYIFFNLGIFAYILSVISTYVFEGELRRMLTNYRILKRMKNLKNHVIVCGFGRNGRKACEELLNSKHTVVIIDSKETVNDNKEVRDNPDIFFLHGDATHDDVLKSAGIENARALISTMPKDSDNVFVTLTARQLNPGVNIISRASEETSESKLIRAGANKVVMPDAVGGRHMATLVTKPDVVEFIEMMNGVGEDALHLDNISYYQLREEWKGKSIGQLDIRKMTGATVIAIKDQFGFTLNPQANKALIEGQTMIILGSRDELHKLDIYKKGAF